MQLTLSEDERQILCGLLESEVRDVRSETYHAESHDVKSALRKREACVRGLLGRLQGAGTGLDDEIPDTEVLEAEAEAALAA